MIGPPRNADEHGFDLASCGKAGRAFSMPARFFRSLLAGFELMPTLMQEMTAKAQRLGVPISVQLDVTYRCNERCVHCYLDHDDHGEMTLAEMRDVLDQMAEAGVFFLTISGGEVLMRMDFFDILAHARARMFSVKVKTNMFMIREKEADRLARAGLA